MSETRTVSRIPKSRIEAFSDGMFAIIITIMVLELKPPHGSGWNDIKTVLPALISYVMSFLFVGVYWGNHHHLLITVRRLSSGIMLTNLNLLFWLSLIPFITEWVGQNNFASLPVAIYAVLLDICGLSYTLLQKMIEACHPEDTHMKQRFEKHGRKGQLSLLCYTAAIPLAYVNSYISIAIFFAVAIIWLIPDKSILEPIDSNS
jgi:uncharacterized membrane protein